MNSKIEKLEKKYNSQLIMINKKNDQFALSKKFDIPTFFTDSNWNQTSQKYTKKNIIIGNKTDYIINSILFEFDYPVESTYMIMSNNMHTQPSCTDPVLALDLWNSQI